MSEYDIQKIGWKHTRKSPEVIEVVVVATILLLGFGILFTIVGGLIDIATGHDIEVEEPCIDKFGHEFKDELCINKIHCGNIYKRFDKRCDVNVGNSVVGGRNDTP